MPEVHPLAAIAAATAIAAAMRENFEPPAPAIPTGAYHCSRCGADLLQNTVTQHWESEVDLDLCPVQPAIKGGFGIWHNPSLLARPKQEGE